MIEYPVILADRVPTYVDEAGHEHLKPHVRVLRETPEGVYLHVTSRADVEGVEIGRANDGETWRRIPEEHRKRLLKANVYRRTDGLSLRTQVQREADVRAPPRQKHASEAVARARALASDPETPVERRSVHQDEIASGDVVEDELLPPHVWARS